MSDDCVFCQIVAGALPSARVFDDAATVAFIPLNPTTEGHVLVVPKRHSRNIFDVPDDDLVSAVRVTRQIALRQRERLSCEGVSVYQANEPMGFQTVFHFHIHVVPRWKGDRVREAWHAEPATPAELERMASRLR